MRMPEIIVSALAVDELADVGKASGGGVDLVERSGQSAAQQFKDNRDRGRGGQSQRVEDVKQQDVGHHHGEEHHHDFRKGEHLRVKDARAGDFHHARREGGAEKNAHARHPHGGAK